MATEKFFYVEMSRTHDQAELITDDAKVLREQGGPRERIATPEGICEMDLAKGCEDQSAEGQAARRESG